MLGPGITGEEQRDSLSADLPSRRRIWSPSPGNQAPGSFASALPQVHFSCRAPLAASLPLQTLRYNFFLQSASCRLSNCSVIYCQWLQREEKKGKEKIPQRYSLVLSVNQTFPVMLIACVSLMYFILLKSFETLQLSSYRPLCGYH